MTYVDSRIKEWRMGGQSRRIQNSVRRVLNELDAEALLRLKDRRLEVKVLSDAEVRLVERLIRTLAIHTLTSVPTPQEWQAALQRWLKRHPSVVIGHSVWAYFPVHRRRTIAQLFQPKQETRVLLVFGPPRANGETAKFFEDALRDHLGHVLLYLRSPSAQRVPRCNQGVAQVTEGDTAMTLACPNRPKFLRYYGALQLRVEQIGPNLWVGSVYYGCLPRQTPNEFEQPIHIWEPPFTELTEEVAKRGALETAFRRIGPAPDGPDQEWRCLSDMPDDHWAKTLRGFAFPGYPEREGLDRWSGF